MINLDAVLVFAAQEAKQFKTDDKRVDEMIKCMEKERDDDPTYLQEIGKRALLRQ